MNLYEQHKKVWDDLAAKGGKDLAKAAKYFSSAADMDRALGFAKAAPNWIAGRNSALTSSNLRARDWLDRNVPRVKDQAPAPSESNLLLIAVPAGKMETARKVLAMIGCEVTDI